VVGRQPSKLIYTGSNPVPRSIESIIYDSHEKPLLQNTPLVHPKQRIQLVDRFLLTVERHPRINVLIDIQRVPKLVRNNLTIRTLIVHERRAATTQDLEIHPTQAEPPRV
jgi:hypothetical protein